MEKEQLDELYHLLRVASLSKSPGDVIAISNIANHLLHGGNYLSLVQYSAYYGEKYLLPAVCELLDGSDLDFNRVVEFGAGLGWLSRGISSHFASKGRRIISYATVDKRAWGAIDIVTDLETDNGVASVIDSLAENDLIVMSDFLHCVEDPMFFIDKFPSWPMLVLEYMPKNTEHLLSFHEQLERFGASSFMPEDVETLFIGRDVEIVNVEPYVVILATEVVR